MSVPHSYRPSILARFYIRLEDFADETQQTQSESQPAADQAAAVRKDLTRLTKQQGQARAAKDTATAEALGRKIKADLRKLRKLKAGTTNARSQQEKTGDAYSISLVTVPLEASVELNSFRIADSMTMTLPFKDAPLVSDLIRSALVEVFVGTVAEEDFADPMKWRLTAKRSNLVFKGYVDTWDTNHDGEDATVQVQARSLESILIDAKINPMAPDYKINGDGEKITTYINRILGKLPATSGQSGGDQLKSLWFGSPPEKEPVLDRALLKRSLQTSKGRNKAAGAVDGQEPPVQGETDQGSTPPGEIEGTGDVRVPPANAGQEMSVWDLITQAAQIAGCIAVYDPTKALLVNGQPATSADYILVTPPQTLYEDVTSGYRIAGGSLDGFSRRFTNPKNGIVTRSDIRFLVWGHNIKSMKTSRKLGRVKAPTIEVIAYNSDAHAKDRTIRVRYPPQGGEEGKGGKTRATRVGAKGEGKTEEVKTFNIASLPGGRLVRSKKQLEQIAVGLYHSLGRQEVSVKLETDDLATYIDPSNPLSHNGNPDVLKLRPGSPVRVTVAREVTDPSQGVILSPLSEVFEKRTDEIVKLLRESRGRFAANPRDATEGKLLDLQVAKRISKALQSARLTDVFYVRTLSHRWSSTDGWSAEMELTNFIEARSLPKNISEEAKALDATMKQTTALTKRVNAITEQAQKKRAQERVDRARRGF